MEDIHSKEVIELIPFAVRRMERCTVSKNKGADEPITLEEFLAFATGPHARSASVHHGYLDATPVWVLYSMDGGVLCAYKLHTNMKVDEARALRVAEQGLS